VEYRKHVMSLFKASLHDSDARRRAPAEPQTQTASQTQVGNSVVVLWVLHCAFGFHVCVEQSLGLWQVDVWSGKSLHHRTWDCRI
jgi:hypothetical protein